MSANANLVWRHTLSRPKRARQAAEASTLNRNADTTDLTNSTSVIHSANNDTATNQHTERTPAKDTPDKRELLVKVLRSSLVLWERYSGKSKIALAEESQCWRVYIDGTTAKTRTLDRYLSTRTLPEKPRWRLAVRTANYVIDHCQLSAEDFEELSTLIDQLNDVFAWDDYVLSAKLGRLWIETIDKNRNRLIIINFIS